MRVGRFVLLLLLFVLTLLCLPFYRILLLFRRAFCPGFYYSAAFATLLIPVSLPAVVYWPHMLAVGAFVVATAAVAVICFGPTNLRRSQIPNIGSLSPKP